VSGGRSRESGLLVEFFSTVVRCLFELGCFLRCRGGGYFPAVSLLLSRFVVSLGVALLRSPTSGSEPFPRRG